MRRGKTADTNDPDRMNISIAMGCTTVQIGG